MPDIVAKKREKDSAEILIGLQSAIASNHRGMKDDEYRKFVGNITNQAGVSKSAEKFDRDAFERLRMITHMGGNKAKGGV